MSTLPKTGLLTGLLVLSACSAKLDDKGLEVKRSTGLASGGEQGDVKVTNHCDAASGHEVSSYDTSGDDVPDVRKVFLRVGTDSLARLVLVCRESDLNSDGSKDVVRYYSDEGAPLREEADRNFDGQMDEVTFFQESKVVRREIDSSGNGKVDLKVFFKDGKPLRSERDIAGRSTASKWQPDRWEYFEENRMVRMGSDVDGDGAVDRWDRDETFRRQQDLERRRAEAAADADAAADHRADSEAAADEG